MSRTSSAKTKQKRYSLDEAKIKHAHKLLGTTSEGESIGRALDEAITERERNRAAWRAQSSLEKRHSDQRCLWCVEIESCKHRSHL